MILVTGATGQVGSAALAGLLPAGAEVRALVREPSGFAAPENVHVVQGHFDDERSLARALEGVDVMLLVGRDGTALVALHLRVLAQARRAGVRHIVKLSAIRASPGSPIALMREQHAVDEEIRKGPADWTFLRPHLFMQNLLRAGEAVQVEGRLAAPMGRERFPLVDTRDVGAAAAAVLRDPAAHAGRTYALTGPAAHGYDEVAAALGDVAGREVVYEPVPPEDFAARLRAAGTPDWRAFDLAHIASAYDAAANAVSPDLAMLLGRAPRSLAAFLEDHRSAFRA